MNYLGSISPKTSNAGGLPPDPCFNSINRKCAKTLFPTASAEKFSEEGANGKTRLKIASLFFFSILYQYHVWKSREVPCHPLPNPYPFCRHPCLLPLNSFGWCRCLVILGQNKTLLFYIFCSTPRLKIVSAPLRGWYLSTLHKNSALKKIGKFVRNIMWFIMNVIIAKKNFSAYIIYLSNSKFSCFEAEI